MTIEMKVDSHKKSMSEAFVNSFGSYPIGGAAVTRRNRCCPGASGEAGGQAASLLRGVDPTG